MNSKVLIGKVAMAISLIVAFGMSALAQDASAPVSNAVLEGVQISSQAGTAAGEKQITCYFIFRDKPTTYFYELKQPEKTLVFEFNDAEKSLAPVPSVTEDPILGFTIDQRKIDVNKEVTGLNPEWHDVITVSFKLRKLPIITMNPDEYSVVSFAYNWTSDPSMVDKYCIKEKKTNPYLIAGIGVGGAAVVGGVVWALLRSTPTVPEGPIPVDDLPLHESTNPLFQILPAR